MKLNYSDDISCDRMLFIMVCFTLRSSVVLLNSCILRNVSVYGERIALAKMLFSAIIAWSALKFSIRNCTKKAWCANICYGAVWEKMSTSLARYCRLFWRFSFAINYRCGISISHACERSSCGFALYCLSSASVTKMSDCNRTNQWNLVLLSVSARYLITSTISDGYAGPGCVISCTKL